MKHSNSPHRSPSQVTAEQGEVHVDGPDGVAVSLTPEAAEETGRRLIEAAGKARSQTESSQTEGRPSA